MAFKSAPVAYVVFEKSAEMNKQCRHILGYHSDDFEEHFLLGCETVQFGRYLPQFQGNIPRPDSDLL